MSPARSFARSRVASIDIVTGDIQEPGEPPVPLPRRAHLILRLHDHPIGSMDLIVGSDTNFLENARIFAWNQLRDEIEQHLAQDSLAKPRKIEDIAKIPKSPCAAPLDVAPDNAPHITVSVSTVDNEDSCLRTVKRILESKYPRFEIVVVDNKPGKSDFGERFGKEITDARVRYVHEPHKGVSNARNRGLEETKTEVVLFVDDDVIVDKNWLFAIGRTFAADPQVGCVTGSILAAEIETPAQAWLEQYGGYNKGFKTQIYDLKENRRTNPLYPYDAGRFGSGANMAVKVESLKKLGGFSTKLGPGTPTHSAEDIDVLRRIVSSGDRLVYEPAAMMWHSHRRSYFALRKQMYRYGAGLSALVTKWMLEDPRIALQVIRRLPAGAVHVLSPKSKKNENKSAYYPRQLTWLERAGIAAGPFLYLKSVAVSRGRK